MFVFVYVYVYVSECVCACVCVASAGCWNPTLPLPSCSQMDRRAWEQEREQLLDQIHRFRISAEGLEVAVVRERKEKEVRLLCC